MEADVKVLVAFLKYEKVGYCGHSTPLLSIQFLNQWLVFMKNCVKILPLENTQPAYILIF